MLQYKRVRFCLQASLILQQSVGMFVLKLARVPNNFVSFWIQCNDAEFYKEMKPDKQNQVWIKDKRIANEIRSDYQSFKSSKLTLDGYFQRTILYGSYTREKEKIYIRSPEIEIKSKPIFLINNRDKSILTGWSIGDFQSRKAIKMKTEYIFKLYGKCSICLDPGNPPDYVEIYEINKGIDFSKLGLLEELFLYSQKTILCHYSQKFSSCCIFCELLQSYFIAFY